jgi:hypothetical protein
VLGALALAACGDSAPSLDEFGREASEVCARGGANTQQLGEPKLATAYEWTRRTEAILDDVAARLRELERPEGADGETARRFVETYERELEEVFYPALRAIGRAARSGDDAATLRAAARFDAVETPESDRLAREVDAPACHA